MAIDPDPSNPHLWEIKNPVLSDNLKDLSGGEFVGALIRVIIGFLFTGGVIAFLIIFLIGGIRWITSGGDKAASEGARKQLTNAGIGLVLLFSVFAIIKLVETVFGISILELTIPTL
ncbi:pilin [Patescibacteria group bacterium]|nr:pilin [Patescibacteria group bacterium]